MKMPFLVPILQSYNKFSEKMVMRENEAHPTNPVGRMYGCYPKNCR